MIVKVKYTNTNSETLECYLKDEQIINIAKDKEMLGGGYYVIELEDGTKIRRVLEITYPTNTQGMNYVNINWPPAIRDISSVLYKLDKTLKKLVDKDGA